MGGETKMRVCEYCGTEDIEYRDRDDTEQYCGECYDELTKEYVKANGIRKL